MGRGWANCRDAMNPVIATRADTKGRPGLNPARRRALGVCLALAVQGALVLGLASAGCSPSRENPAKDRPRILIIGIDGASPLITFPMMKSGQLPHLAKLAREGVSGPLRSVLPLYSPRIWNTIATGRPAKEHGIPAFVKKTDTGDKELYLSSDRQVPALWNILSFAGRTVGVVNWWTTYPPEKITGVMVSDHFFPEQISMIKKTFKANRVSDGALVHPEDWTPRAQARLAETAPLTDFSDLFRDNEALPHWVSRPTLSQQYTTDEEIVRVALGLQADHHPDVLMVFLPGIDRVSHWLWGNLEPNELYPPGLQPSAKEREAGAAALRQYYSFTDALIGQLLKGYTPEDLVLVVSDHGFEAGVSLMLLTGKHDSPNALNGVLFARGRGIPVDEPAGPVNVYELAPSVLAFAGLPVAQDMAAGPAPFLGEVKIAPIPSYDDIPIERYAPARSGNEDDIIEHLRALGYLEEETPAEAGSQQSAP